MHINVCIHTVVVIYMCIYVKIRAIRAYAHVRATELYFATPPAGSPTVAHAMKAPAPPLP